MKNEFNFYKSFMAKNAPQSPKAEDLKKESENLYTKKLQEEARLLELYNKKKLTNKNTIRKARAIAQKYAEQNAKKAGNAGAVTMACAEN